RPRVPSRCPFGNFGNMSLEGRLRRMKRCEFRLELRHCSLGDLQLLATVRAGLTQLHAPKAEPALPVAARLGKISRALDRVLPPGLDWGTGESSLRRTIVVAARKMMVDGRDLRSGIGLVAVVVVAVVDVACRGLRGRRQVEHGKANRPIGIQGAAFEVIR